MTRKCTPLDVYFHMANHYRKLRLVKSVVDTSSPIGFYDKVRAGRQSRPPSRSENSRQSTSKSASSNNSDRPCNESKYRRTKHEIVKHDCLNKAPNPTTRSQSLPPRPPTRRKPADMPNPHYNPSRARSSGPSLKRHNANQKSRSARSQRSFANSTPIYSYFTTSIKASPTHKSEKPVSESPVPPPTPAPRNTKCKKRDVSYKNSVSDHEYLQFSLRITEDIIRNDLYSNKEMRRVFNSHIEANRGRLDMTKMTQQIDNLCRELNIPCDDSHDDDIVTTGQVKVARQGVGSSLACICEPVGKPPQDCECGSTRCLPFQCIQHGCGNTENATDKPLSTDAALSNERSVKQKSEAEDNLSFSSNLNEGVIETHYYESARNNLAQSSMPLLLAEDEMYRSVSDFNEVIQTVRPSQAFIKLPSLSCVSERTEPTTSTDTMDWKLESSEQNDKSVSAFESSDTLPGFENLEKSEHIKPPLKQLLCTNSGCISRGLGVVKNITFGGSTIKSIVSNPVEEEASEGFIGFNSVDQPMKSSPTVKLQASVPVCIEHTSSDTLNENMLWLICSYPSPKEHLVFGEAQSNSKCTPSLSTESNKYKEEDSASHSQVHRINSAPPTYPTHSQTITNEPKINTLLLQTQSEPIKALNRVPIPIPRSNFLRHQDISPETKPFMSSTAPLEESSAKPSSGSLEKKNKKDGDNSKRSSDFQILQVTETSNIKIRGPHNLEEEFVLVPGPIYIPKSSIKPVKSDNNQSMPVIASFSKDAMVNTEEQLVNVSNLNYMLYGPDQSTNFNISNKESSDESHISSFNTSMKTSNVDSFNSASNTESGSTTYSQIHDSANNTIHYPSFTSDISQLPDIPHAKPISESLLMDNNLMNNFGKPPKTILKHKYLIPMDVPQSVSNYESKTAIGECSCRLEELNDYDLTPQRDSDNSQKSNGTTSTVKVAESKPFFFQDRFKLFNKETLLLGDEYEIKHEFSNKSSTLSCYDNGLPYAICKFYPNNSTQTQSSDWLLPPSSSTKLVKSTSDRKCDPKNAVLNTNYVQEQKEEEKEMLPEQEIKSEHSVEKPAEKEESEVFSEQTIKSQKSTEEPAEEREHEMFFEQNVYSIEKLTEEKKKEVSLEQENKRKTPLGGSAEEWLKNDSLEIKFQKRFSSDTFKSLESITNKQRSEEHSKESNESKLTVNNVPLEEEAKSNTSVLLKMTFEENIIPRDTEVEEEDIENNIDENEDDEIDDEVKLTNDMLRKLDRAPSVIPRLSMMLTVEQVKKDLQKVRDSNILSSEYIQAKHNVPTEKQSLIADDLPKLSSVTGNTGSKNYNISRKDSSDETVPHIEVPYEEEEEEQEKKDTQLDAKKETSQENKSTLCCGLEKLMNRKRRDIVEINGSVNKIPNISTIPDDQLFNMDARKLTTNPNVERKNLRFDYSRTSEAQADEDFLDYIVPHSEKDSTVGANKASGQSEDLLTTISNALRGYQIAQSPSAESIIPNSIVSFNTNVTTINESQPNLLVEILPPPTNPTSDESMQILDENISKKLAN